MPHIRLPASVRLTFRWSLTLSVQGLAAASHRKPQSWVRTCTSHFGSVRR